MEPAFLSLVVGQAITSIKFAVTYRRELKGAQDRDRREVREAQELALHYWGALLFECRRNVERARLMDQEAKRGTIFFAAFDFSISDALMPEFCRVVPSPALLDQFHSVLAALRRIDFFQRAAAQVQPGKPALDHHRKAAAFAIDAMKKELVGRFNTLVQLGDLFGAEIYGDENWAGGEDANLLPAPINPKADVDRAAI